MSRKGEFSYATFIIENNKEVLQKIKNRTILWFNCPTAGYIAPQFISVFQAYTCTHDYCSKVHNSQDIKSTKVSFSRQMDTKKKWYICNVNCVSQFSTTMTKYLRKSTQSRKDVFLFHGFKNCSPWSLGSIVSWPMERQNIRPKGTIMEKYGSPHGDQKAKYEREEGVVDKRYPSELLPPTLLHFLMFPTPLSSPFSYELMTWRPSNLPKAPPLNISAQAFTHELVEWHLRSKPYNQPIQNQKLQQQMNFIWSLRATRV